MDWPVMKTRVPGPLREPGIVALLALLAGLSFAALRLASEVMEGDTLGFDKAILLWLRVPGDPKNPIGPPWVTDTVVNITSLGSNVVLAIVVLVVAGFLLVSGKRASALFVVGSATGGALLSMALKNLFVRPRPEIVAHIVQAHSTSFPSGHSLGAAATYLTLGLLITRFHPARAVRIYAVAVAILLTLLVGLSRIYLGVHWPTDVLAGWCIGGAWAILCWLLAAWLQRRRVVEQSDEA